MWYPLKLPRTNAAGWAAALTIPKGVGSHNISVRVNSYDDSESIDSKDESIFIERALKPFLNAIFPVGSDLKKDGNFTALIGNTDMKPDIKYKARIGTTDFGFLVFEVKRPRSFAEDDLFKASIELQFMLNGMVKKKTYHSLLSTELL